ncbi:unnamed protein product [Cylindrotheca closterium]|uniref:Cleft lip and palate transmembrane protein 1-like protein n=1 Tax=Cylindrotheca closterium TaxID=2856 RepID=A0AAD2PWM6_9STRA|nr:unnamed protein product [Cylindrotheca closterium]
MLSLWIGLFVAYLSATWISLQQAVKPAVPCRPGSNQCFQPLLSPSEPMTLELRLYQPSDEEQDNSYRWRVVESCMLNFSLPSSNFNPIHLTKNETCEVPIPNFARFRSPDESQVRPLKARFILRLQNNYIAAAIPFDLTRINFRRDGTYSNKQAPRNLMEEPLAASNRTQKEKPVGDTWIPYLKYGRSPVRIRIVSDFREYGVLQRNDGAKLEAFNRTAYRPMVYVDDLALPHSSQNELGPPEANKPPVKLQIKIGAIPPMVDSLNQQFQVAFAGVESFLPGEDLDEIRYLLQDEKLYRFALTQVISYIHIWVDYLAFRDEIGFYRGKENMSGVSSSTVILRFICSFIILLYLLDGGSTSWVVLLSLISSCTIEAWKVWKLVNPQLSLKFPFLIFQPYQNAKAKETAEYDRMATKNLAMILYPLVIGWSIYALKHYQYKSWYSWLVSNLANAVYTFGFISLCPQLYVNYRLKSVAHLPWKVFMYKLFNTFVDDAFAWLIDMPWKHRIMTLRDDVVFIMFLVQVYLYKVDKSRVNEFGYAFEESKQEEPSNEQKKKTD